MCGIAGLFLKDPELEPRLGELLAGMLGVLTDRGPDSAGFAVYGPARPGAVKLTLRLAEGEAAAALLERMPTAGIEATARADHLVVTVPEHREAAFRADLAALSPATRVVASGHRMELFKRVGPPRTVSQEFGLPRMAGSHAIGHTRMATESAVTTDGAHPFSTGRDQCLVHNGSLSNHNALRRGLRRRGMHFDTDNDTEVAARYLSARLGAGETLQDALGAALDDLDGFYTFVAGTGDGFGVLRDPVACKPAVIAETERYVAFGSEYRALVDLPDIERARVFEPEPARVYAWTRA
jgi:glutamate synthase domain-containing protein 1